MEYVAKIESTPVCGVEIKNELVAPLDAPFLKNEIPVGITPHEQSGIGIPSNEAFTDDLKSDFPRYLSMCFCGKYTFNKPANINPSKSHGAISSRRNQSSSKYFTIYSIKIVYQLKQMKGAVVW
jgi:hypothetical protein